METTPRTGFLSRHAGRSLLFLAGAALGVAVCLALLLRPADGEEPVVATPHAVHRADRIRTDGAPEPIPSARNGIRVYFDGVHGARHLYNRDNRRYRTDYHTISGWYRLLQGLRAAGYEVHGEDYACFDAESLAPYQVFMIGESTYHGRFMTDAERAALVDWVERGGGLFLTVEHTNAHFMADVFNALAAEMPIAARFDSICDKSTSDRHSPDWVTLAPIREHPVVEGVRRYHFYNGCSLDTPHGVLWSSEDSWSDRYDPKNQPPVHNGNKKRDKGELAGPLAGVAAFEFGAGRVVVIADHNALTNTSLYRDDHHRFAMNAIRWLARAEDRAELVDWRYPGGYDLLIHTGAGSEFALHRKTRALTFRSAYGFLSKEPQLRPWTSDTLRADDEVLLLGAPTGSYTEDELGIIERVLASGRPVIWLATIKSLDSEAGGQLQERFGFRVLASQDPNRRSSPHPYEVHGPAEWTRGIYRVFTNQDTPAVRVEGLEPIVRLTWGSRHVGDRQWERREVLIDLVSSKAVGPGRLFVIAPFDLFDDRELKDLYSEGADVVRQQMSELVLRAAKIAAGDETVYAD